MCHWEFCMERTVSSSIRNSMWSGRTLNLQTATSIQMYVSSQHSRSSLTFNAQPLRKNLENSRWSILKDMPQDIRSYASSLDCLDLISQTSPGQERLKRVSVEMSYHIIMLFMEGLVPKILKRLRALQSLELIVKIKDWTWASCYSGPTGRSRGDHPFDRDFLLLIKSQLGHVKTIKTKYYNTENALDSADEDNSDEDEPDEGRCEWVLEQLQNRNRAWTPQTPGDNRFVRTTCTMTALDPGVLSNISDIEFGWRKIKKSRRDTDGRNTHISDKTRNVFD